jgi:ankyrin repeat protein
LTIVEALVAAFPQAVTDQDVHGDTPLHVALMNPEANCEVVHALLKACPTVASVANTEGLYPLHVACRHCPDEKVIDVLLEEYPYALRHAIKVSPNLCVGGKLNPVRDT